MTDNEHTLLNPVLLVEVLSPSTRSYDQGEKFEHYRSIPCLQDYLLIDAERIYVAHHQRQGPHQWLLREYYQLTDELTLTAAGLTVSLAEIYQGTKW